MGLDFIRLFNKKLEEKDIDWEVSALASPDRGELTYTSLDGYFDVQEEQGNDIARLKRNYEYWKKTHK